MEKSFIHFFKRSSSVTTCILVRDGEEQEELTLHGTAGPMQGTMHTTQIHTLSHT